VGTLDMAATRFLGAVGINAAAPGGPAPINKDTGLVINGNQPIATSTVPTWPVPVIPQASPLANSLTPAPSPTPSPTPTDVPTRGPCTSNCGGGGTIAGNITTTPSPANWASGQTGASYLVHATDGNGQPEANVYIGIIYTWANNVTWLDEKPPNGSPTDSNGDYISYLPQVGTCPSSHVFSVKLFALFPKGSKSYGFSIPCH
jgi:hypothetical protein